MTSGRKREFDYDIALDAAMHVFWLKGYAGASFSDLIEKMNINKPSIYRAFGNKEDLFIKATQRYLDTKMKTHMALLFEEGVALKTRFKQHMMSIVDMQCSTTNAKGCYLALCQSELIGGGIPLQAELMLKETDGILTKCYEEIFSNDPEAILLGLDKNAKSNSLSLYTILKGTASMARSGAVKSELEYSVDTILAGIGLH
nr:TetR/AcrR family transcriptional regulator [uncultured Glaciecola sp.]